VKLIGIEIANDYDYVFGGEWCNELEEFPEYNFKIISYEIFV